MRCCGEFIHVNFAIIPNPDRNLLNIVHAMNMFNDLLLSDSKNYQCRNIQTLEVLQCELNSALCSSNHNCLRD